MPVQDSNGKARNGDLLILFFIHAMAMGMWFVPLSTVLDAHGFGPIKPYAFAASALAAFVSPLIFGAMADRHASPVKVLRWLSVAAGLSMALASLSIHMRWPAVVVLGCVQLHALCASPTWSISSTIVFGRLRNSKREFGPIRAMATFGWMVGCWVISALNADTTAVAGFSGSIMWLALAIFSFKLPEVAPPKSAVNLTLRERLGLDALTLLKKKDHRVVFITAALFSIPLTTFYAFTPPHLRELGLNRSSAWMSLGQVTEIIALLGLGALLSKWRLKWIFAGGLAFGVLRFGMCAMNEKTWLLLSVLLHGFAFTLFFITAQIYLDERVDSSWRARAQALMSLVTGGVGNLAGYLGNGWWFAATSRDGQAQWPLFWGGVTAILAIVLVYFLAAYRGQGTGARKNSTGSQAQQTEGG